MSHMGNEAVHRIVCSLTDCALPRNIFFIFFYCLNLPERMIARPNTLIMLREWVGEIYQTHGGGRCLLVLCVCTHSKVLDDRISLLHGGIVGKGGRSAF